MRQRIDPALIYADALYLVEEEDDDSGAPRSWPETCRLALHDLLVIHPGVDALIGRFHALTLPTPTP